MKYLQAVHIWNRKKREVSTDHVFAVPRKGTPEYDEVKIIMKSPTEAAYQDKKEAVRRAMTAGAAMRERLEKHKMAKNELLSGQIEKAAKFAEAIHKEAPVAVAAVEAAKKRGRPRKPAAEPVEKKPRGRPAKAKAAEPVEKKPRGRPAKAKAAAAAPAMVVEEAKVAPEESGKWKMPTKSDFDKELLEILNTLAIIMKSSRMEFPVSKERAQVIMDNKKALDKWFDHHDTGFEIVTDGDDIILKKRGTEENREMLADELKELYNIAFPKDDDYDMSDVDDEGYRIVRKGKRGKWRRLAY